MALKKLAVNMAVLSAARMLQTVSSFLAIPILARLLEPAEFGLVSMASIFVMLTMAIGDAGLSMTLVRVDIRERDVWSSAFWFIGGVGLALSLLLALVAWPMAWLMREPELTPIILTFALVPLLQAISSPAGANLQQREKFPQLAAAELSGSLSGTAAALGLGFAGFGAWALVMQQVAYVVVKSALLMAASTFRPGLTFRWEALGPQVAMSIDNAALGLVAFFQRQFDPILIGRFLGAAPLGAYAMAHRIAFLPSMFFTTPLQNALFTRMVMVRGDAEATRKLLLVAAWIVAAVVFPGMAVGAAASDAVIRVFLSDKWAPAAPVFAALAPTFAFQSVMMLSGAMLLALGATGRRLRLNIEFTLAWLLVVPFAAMHSVVTVALAYTAIYALYSIRSYPMFLAPAGCTVGDLFKTLAAPIAVALCAACVHLAVQTLAPMGKFAEAGTAAAVLLCAYASLAWVERKKLGDRIDVLRSILSQRGRVEGEA